MAALLLGVLGGCGELVQAPAAPSYVVRAGDTLYSISTRHGLDYHDVARWNGLVTDFRIAPGQLLRLGPGADAGPLPLARAVLPPALPAAPAPPWVWPAAGPVGGSIQRPGGGVGIEINGMLGAEVRAAAAGRVVYTGSGLRAYGQLIIIKHGESWLTAYGYNQQVFVVEGDSVASGQRIATIGTGPANRALLYFEIRQNGKSVDPLGQLPPRD